MKRWLILMLCCCLMAAGAAEAESALYPGFRWASLLETPWEAELTGRVKAVMPLDEERTGELNSLLSHLLVRLAWSPGDNGGWGAFSAAVDGTEAVRVEQWTDGTLTAAALPGQADAYVSGSGNPLEMLLGADVFPEDLMLPDWTFTWLADADRLAENLTSLEPMKSRKVKESVQSVGTAVQQLSWTTGKDDGDHLWQAVVNACPEGALRTILAGFAAAGKQSLVLLCGKDGGVMKVTYTGRLQPTEGEVRQVSLTWRRRRNEIIFDKLTLRTPTLSGKDRNNLVFERSVKDVTAGRRLKITFTVDAKAGKDKDRTTGDIQLTAAEQLTGTAKIIRDRSGSVEGRRSLTLTPALTVAAGEKPAVNGEVTWQWREDGHITDAWTVQVSMGPLLSEAPAWPEKMTDVDSMNPEEREAAGQAAVQAVTPGLIRALVLLPPEDALFLSRELLAWDEIVSAAQADGQ